jgi:hypothetical protein
MRFALVILIFVPSLNVAAQLTGSGPLLSRVIVDTKFKDTLTFDKKWDYPWYIVVDDGGNMENAIGDKITSDDTVHLYHTANCWTNHQGVHHVRYSDALLFGDTLKLIFQAELPAYASGVIISINGNSFSSSFSAAYPARSKNKPAWYITKQKLVLDKDSYIPGETVRGYVNVEFIETDDGAKPKEPRRKYYYKGYFKTKLLVSDANSSPNFGL